MKPISNADGVTVIIPPVTGNDGFQSNIDFSAVNEYLESIDNLSKDWELSLSDGENLVGTVKLTVYQFLAEGVDRRTVALKNLTIEPAYRNQGQSYEVLKFALSTVKFYCDANWGEIEGDPVIFIEKKDTAQSCPLHLHNLFEFLKKIGEKILGREAFKQPSGGELSVTVIGDQVSMQLIEGHLSRTSR
jgi:hypothetical protein